MPSKKYLVAEQQEGQQVNRLLWVVKKKMQKAFFLLKLAIKNHTSHTHMHLNYISQTPLQSQLHCTHYISAYRRLPGQNSHIYPNEENKLWTQTISLMESCVRFIQYNKLYMHKSRRAFKTHKKLCQASNSHICERLHMHVCEYTCR